MIIGDIATEDAHCTICLGDYVEGESIKFLPGCHHHFHATCTDEWLVINKTCPLCVRDVQEELDRESENNNNITNSTTNDSSSSNHNTPPPPLAAATTTTTTTIA